MRSNLPSKNKQPRCIVCYHLYVWNETIYKYLFAYAKFLREGHQKLVAAGCPGAGNGGWGEEHEEDFTFTVFPSVPLVSYADVSY